MNRHIKIAPKGSLRTIKREGKAFITDSKRQQAEYNSRLLERCRILPFSAEELRLAGVADMNVPMQKMIAWWMLVINNILLDADFAPADNDIDMAIPVRVKGYLYYHCEKAEVLFWHGTFSGITSRLMQANILNEALRISNALHYGHITQDDALGKIKEIFRVQIAFYANRSSHKVSEVCCVPKVSLEELNRAIGAIQWLKWINNRSSFTINTNRSDNFAIATIAAPLIAGTSIGIFLESVRLCILLIFALYAAELLIWWRFNPRLCSKRRYLRSMWEHSRCLPLSDDELDELGILSLSTPVEQMSAWWVFIISAVLTDFGWAIHPTSKKFNLPDKLQAYLLKQADFAARRFWGNIPHGLCNAEILKYAWETIVWHFYYGDMEPKEAEQRIMKMIQLQLKN